jgi:hypothetical protein
MKLPNDFIHHDGTGRPQCWVRNDSIDMATIYQDNYNIADLKRLAKWCAEAAEYLECKQSIDVSKSTKRTQSKGK